MVLQSCIISANRKFKPSWPQIAWREWCFQKIHSFHGCAWSFLFLEQSLETDVIWDLSLLCSGKELEMETSTFTCPAELAAWCMSRQWIASTCEGLKVVGHDYVCDLLGSGAEHKLSPWPQRKNRKKLFLLGISSAGWLFAFLVFGAFLLLERGHQTGVEKNKICLTGVSWGVITWNKILQSPFTSYFTVAQQFKFWHFYTCDVDERKNKINSWKKLFLQENCPTCFQGIRDPNALRRELHQMMASSSGVHVLTWRV